MLWNTFHVILEVEHKVSQLPSGAEFENDKSCVCITI